MRGRLIRATVFAVLLASAGTAKRAVAAEPAVSLSSYWRYWVTHSPPRLSEPHVDRKGRKHVELAPPRGWHIYGRVRSISTPDAAPGCQAADFDDSAWPVARMPLCTGSGQSFWDQPLTVRRLVARARFVVPDPAAVKRLTLKARFRGGMAVYVNGSEVTRAHLPAGRLAADAQAESYPRGAYMTVDEAEAAAGKKLTYFGVWTGKIFWRWKSNAGVRALAEKVRARRERSVTVEIPAKLLRKGVNVLAVDARAATLSPLAWRWRYDSDSACASFWSQLHIEELEVTCAPLSAARAVRRPEGVQLWAEDVHRWVLSADFLEPGVKPGALRIVAARNGAFSGQAVLGTSRELKGLKATVSDLTGPGKIPASAVALRWGVATPLAALLENYGKGALRSRVVDHALVRYARSLGLGQELEEARRRRRILDLAGPSGLCIFDHLSERAPEGVKANSAQTLWATVNVPVGTPAGEYRGKISVAAAGLSALTLDLNVRVSAFKLAPSREWRTFAGVEESPYAVAKKYGLKTWSEEHWSRVGECMAWLGKLGNNFVKVPLLAGSRMGNADSIVVWVKKGESYEYDWSVLDRYAGLARRHCGRPLALVALVHPPFDLEKGAKLAVSVRENGALRRMDLPPPGSPEFGKLWVPFCKAFVQHVREKKLADSVHWGMFYDKTPSTLAAMARGLAAAVPEVGWMRASHLGKRNSPFRRDVGARVDFDAHIRCFEEPDWEKGGVGRRGLARKDLDVLYPREASQVTALPAFAPLWHLRELPELSITSNARGFTRIAADNWTGQGGGWFVPAILYILYPGKGRVEGSVQLEMLREGLQECEARIALESRRPDHPVLKQRTGCAWLLPGGTSKGRTGEFYGSWQNLSGKLYDAAGGR